MRSMASMKHRVRAPGTIRAEPAVARKEESSRGRDGAQEHQDQRHGRPPVHRARREAGRAQPDDRDRVPRGPGHRPVREGSHHAAPDDPRPPRRPRREDRSPRWSAWRSSISARAPSTPRSASRVRTGPSARWTRGPATPSRSPRRSASRSSSPTTSCATPRSSTPAAVLRLPRSWRGVTSTSTLRPSDSRTSMSTSTKRWIRSICVFACEDSGSVRNTPPEPSARGSRS